MAEMSNNEMGLKEWQKRHEKKWMKKTKRRRVLLTLGNGITHAWCEANSATWHWYAEGGLGRGVDGAELLRYYRLVAHLLRLRRSILDSIFLEPENPETCGLSLCYIYHRIDSLYEYYCKSCIACAFLTWIWFHSCDTLPCGWKLRQRLSFYLLSGKRHGFLWLL